MRKLCFISIILLCLGSCVPGHNDYSQFINTGAEGWQYGDTLKFQPQIADSISTGKLKIAIRHTNAYPYSNLWLEIRHFNGDSLRLDTVNIEMADIYGKWHGNGIGANYQYALTISNHITLYRDHPIMINHIMRVDKLPNIEQIGLLFDGIELENSSK